MRYAVLANGLFLVCNILLSDGVPTVGSSQVTKLSPSTGMLYPTHRPALVAVHDLQNANIVVVDLETRESQSDYFPASELIKLRSIEWIYVYVSRGALCIIYALRVWCIVDFEHRVITSHNSSLGIIHCSTQ